MEPVAPPPYDETIVLYMAYRWLHCYPAMTVLPLTTATRLELRSAHSPPSLIPRPPAPGLDHLQYAKNIVQAIQNWNWESPGNEPKLYHTSFVPRPSITSHMVEGLVKLLHRMSQVDFGRRGLSCGRTAVHRKCHAY